MKNLKSTVLSIEEAVGLPLSHDLTMIDPQNKYKGAKFKRGHILTKDDLPILRRMGRMHLSVLELAHDEVHEDLAAIRLGEKFKSCGFSVTSPSEGRCNLKAEKNGLLIIDEQMVNRINSDKDWVLSTIANFSVVKKGDVVAAWRIGPLAMTEDRVAAAEAAIENSALKFKIAEFSPFKTALITTGAEIFKGEINDAFSAKLPPKLEKYGAPLVFQTIVPDDKNAIIDAIMNACDAEAEVILCTGGMSVDADDLTPAAIREVCGEVIFKGTPVLPGSNLMLGKKSSVYILGVPACAVHADVTVLDTVMNRIYASVPPSGDEVRTWGVGGLCRACDNCNFPVCSFGSR